ncbi:helix-turn-helix domain-containing protein [Paenibacillus allorhizosphaerae]|uniref:RCS-specific HTH-type transcriptional activator RclR n=1 Tax=Paenibacillus allorhizosphaerae TaxID=2849866 RepID=A0ABM8VJ08_9BACL|nr:helix-turn-helix domain-containing protein [Paenibacillus allorhizosphaerae]CAG7644879.1 RCS-specific HTH-type transcriptional activator RclR [Paenibacillus allorhizosphaerae]
MVKSVEMLPGAVKERVVYQNPLLFLDIYELRRNSVLSGKWHHHKEVELLAIIKGRIIMHTKHESAVLEAGDVFLIGSSQPHRTDRPSTDEVHYVVLQVHLSPYFDQSTLPFMHGLSELTRPLDDLNYIFKSDPTARQEAFRLIMHIFEEMTGKRKGHEMAVGISVRSLLLLLVRHDRLGMLKASEDIEIMRLRPVLQHVEAHIAEKVTVEDACRLLNFSYHYFVKYFKKVMGLTFLDYLNFKRIKLAECMLLTQELSIAEIGHNVGIPNISQFYKMFKRYNHCSPKEFRARLRKRDVTEEPV